MIDLDLPEKRVQIETVTGPEGQVLAEEYWRYAGLDHNHDQRRIEVKGFRRTFLNGRQTSEVPHNYTISNYSYRAPVVDNAGEPVMIEESYFDEAEGVQKTRLVQKSIGEVDMWFKKIFEPIIWPSVELGAMVDLGLLASNPIKYVE